MTDARATAFDEGLRQENAGRLPQALASYIQCTVLNPQDVDAWLRIGFCLLQMNLLRDAAATFTTVTTLQPRQAMGWYGQAVTQFQLGQHSKAWNAVEHAAALAPEHAAIWAARALMQAAGSHGQTPTSQGFVDWARRFADPLTQAASPIVADTTLMRRLRVGFMSADLREHALVYFVEPLLRTIDHAAFQWHAFNAGPYDSTSERLEALFDVWHDIRALDDATAWALVREQKIDILVDLSGHTLGHRLGVFARRAAPVQLTWLGFLYTTGLQAMDWRLTDASMDPAEAQSLHVERLFNMRCMAVFAPSALTPDITPLPARDNGYITFISLNGFKKIADPCLQAWSVILQRIPSARLLIVGFEGEVNEQDAQWQRLVHAGLPVAQVDVLPRLALEQFVALGNVADVALDSFPSSGGTTTLHALWMGLPVICIEGHEATRSASASTLSGLGQAQFVAKNVDDYVRLAIDQANNLEALQTFRDSIRARLAESPLMDYPGFTLEFERALRLMWFNYCIGEPRYTHTNYDLANEAVACEALALP